MTIRYILNETFQSTRQVRKMRLTRSRWTAIKAILRGRPVIHGARIILANEKSAAGISITNMSLTECYITPGDKPGVYGSW